MTGDDMLIRAAGKLRALAKDLKDAHSVAGDFLQGVKLEAAHQVLRWGEAHDRDKSAENWYWLVGHLAGKALRAAITGNRDKALHHCISSAAALLNWHKAIKRDTTGAGVGADADLDPSA